MDWGSVFCPPPFRQCWRGTLIHHLGMSRKKLTKQKYIRAKIIDVDVPFSVGTVRYCFILLHIFAKLIEFTGGARPSENHQNIVLFTCQRIKLKGFAGLFCSRVHFTQLSTYITVLHPPRVDSRSNQWTVKMFKCFMIFPRDMGIIPGKFPLIAFLSLASLNPQIHSTYKLVSFQNISHFLQTPQLSLT